LIGNMSPVSKRCLRCYTSPFLRRYSYVLHCYCFLRCRQKIKNALVVDALWISRSFTTEEPLRDSLLTIYHVFYSDHKLGYISERID
jgi:hypothetical protein